MSNFVTGVLVFAITVAAYVVLTVKGEDAAGLLTLATPVIGALLVIQRLDARSNSQDQVLGQITRQTNGVLSQRIAEVVSGELDKRFGPKG